jgi:hypothetical protein
MNVVKNFTFGYCVVPLVITSASCARNVAHTVERVVITTVRGKLKQPLIVDVSDVS